MNVKYPEIRDLAVIGDRQTVALISTDGSIVWYCPGRFDRPSLFASLLDTEKGGIWSLNLTSENFSSRCYLEDSGVLETTFKTAEGEFKVTDWMPKGDDFPCGICRRFSKAPQELRTILQPAPNYARHTPKLRQIDQATVEISHSIDEKQSEDFYFYASHPLEIKDNRIHCSIPQGESGWTVLFDNQTSLSIEKELDNWLETTINRWREITSHIKYHGPFETEVAASIRAIRLLTYEKNGGIIAAPTASLPEVIEGERNYDYRYVWLRDSGMIVSALIRAGSDGTEDRRFLDFICKYNHDYDGLPVLPFLTLSGETAPDIEYLDLEGYRHSKPVRIGNVANNQLQLDAYGNVLLAAKLIYKRFDTLEHWILVEEIADFLAENWHQPDYGIWEETIKRQYTTGKVVTACGLKYIAEHSKNKSKADRWLAAVSEIRDFVAENCINSEGSYSAIAGEEAVDVSAALYPVWGYTDADSPEMLATINQLEREFSTNNLYHRHLELFDSYKEGAFLAGTLWVAQYWVMRRDFEKVQTILNEVLKFSNDLGLFSEEADPQTGRMLGNFPQTFVHAAFIGAVLDLKSALENAPQTSKEMFSTK